MSQVFIAPISLGLGDLVVSLPAIQAVVAQARRTHDEAWLVARSDGQRALAERIDGLAGVVSEATFDPHTVDGRFVDLRDHPLQRDHWWGSPEFDHDVGPLTINEILGRICADVGIDADFSRPAPLLARDRPDVRDAVLVVAESDGPSKRWPADRWAALAAAIGHAGGETRLVTRRGASPELHATGIEELCVPTPGDAVDVLGACRAVVGIDTGLTHLAVQQGTPTVTISRDRPVYFRAYPHTRVVVGDRCTDACTALERERAYHDRVSLRGFDWQPRPCPTEGSCLQPIRPDDVMRALEELW